MEIEEVTDKEFSKIIPYPYHVFGSGSFANLNTNKADKVVYLLFKNSKYRLGITGGLKDYSFNSPFSSPFGGFNYINDDIKINFIDEALYALSDWAIKRNLKTINITLPPTIYNESFITKQANCLFRNSYILRNIDLNYSFNLIKFDEDYIQNIWYNARKNLKMALKSEFIFKRCISLEENKLAYEIIKKNRELRGFPLRMTWIEIEKTISIIPSDFFLVYNSNNIPVASAIIFHVSSEKVQVIYWGDLPDYNGLKTMNFLSYKIFEFYMKTHMKIIDIGPSSENSIPNLGLCEFKESIGCDISQKFSFAKNL